MCVRTFVYVWVRVPVSTLKVGPLFTKAFKTSNLQHGINYQRGMTENNNGTDFCA